MAATYIVKGLSPQGGLEETEKTTATVVYQVQASEPTTLAHAAALASAPTLTGGVPMRGSTLPGAAGVPCVRRAWKFADGTRTLIIATLEYDSTVSAVENPLDAPTQVSNTTEQTEEEYFADETTPTPVRAIHTNNLPFTELPTRQRAIRVFDVVKNVPHTMTDATFAALVNKVNDATLTIDGRVCPAETVWCAAADLSAIQTMNGVQYRTLRSTLKFKDSTWTRRIESRSLWKKGSTPSKLIPITDADGHPINEPWPLDADGNALTPNNPGFVIPLRPYAKATLSPLV